MTVFQKHIIVLIILYVLFFAFFVVVYFHLGHISSSELGIDSKQIPQWSRSDLIAMFAAVGALVAPIAVLYGLHDWKRQHLTGEKLKLLYEINELNGEIKGVIDDVRDRNFYMMIKIGDFDYHEDFKKYFREYYKIVNNIALKNHSLELIDLDGDLREVKKILDILEIISKNFYDSYNYFRAEINSENQRTAESFDIHRMMLSSEPVKLLVKDPENIINEVEKRYTSHFENIDKILKKAVTKI